MATSMAALSRRISRYLLSNPNSAFKSHQFTIPFCSSTTHLTSDREGSDLEEPPSLSSDSESLSPEPSSTKDSIKNHGFKEPQLENGLDMGIYKAIVVGRVGQKPIQKRLKSGLTLTMFSVGTGGMRNNRRPLENESPQEFAERSSIHWHRVCVYPERLGDVVMKHAVPGSILYLEGNLESKIFTDPITGIVRRIREVSIRRNCRIVFLSKGGDAEEPIEPQINGVRY